MKNFFKIIISMIFVFAIINAVKAKTTIADPGGLLPPSGMTEAISKLDKYMGDFGPAFANAYLMGNLAGYPVGTSILGGFPHFLAGVSLNTGLSNLERFDSDVPDRKEIYPAAGLAPALFFGLGSNERMDAMFKFMLFSEGFYSPPTIVEYASLKKLNLYSIGGKVRYSAIKPVPVIPGIFKFGGITLHGGADFMYGIIEISGDNLSVPMGQIEVFDPFPTLVTYDISLESDYVLQNSWYICSLSTSALVYFEAFWIFSLYTGAGFALSYGSFDIDFDSTSILIRNDTSAQIGSDSITINSTNSFRPYYYSPLYILGFEINLFLMRLSFETMVNLRNASDINLQLGARIQF